MRSNDVMLSGTRPFVWRCLVLIGVIASLAGSSLPVAGQTPTPPAAEETTQAKSNEEEPVEIDEIIAEAAEEVAPRRLSAPAWLAPNRNIDFRFRPNSGIRLRPLPSDPSLLLSDGSDGLKPWSFRLSLPTFPADSDFESAKFQENRDIRNGAGAGLEAHILIGESAVGLLGRHLGLEDQDVFIGAAEPGKYVFSLALSETPHRYSFDARSLYDGVGTSLLTIGDEIQADLQSSTSSPVAAGRIAGHVADDGQSVEIGLRRRKVGADFTLMTMYPFTIRAAVSNESRDGVRPSSASFGLGNFVELPWPVVDDTRDVRLMFEYAKAESRLYASGAVRVSSYDQQNSTLSFDNPYRATDASSTAAFVATIASGPTSGLLVLPPSNTYKEATLSSVFSRLPMRTSVSALFSAGFMRQNEALVPFSTNTAARLPGPDGQLYAATDPNALPRPTAETAMNTVNAQVRLTSQPAKRFRVVAQYQFFDLDNNGTPFVIPAFIRTDADIRNPVTPGGTFSSLNNAYNRHKASAEGSFELPANSRFSLGYTWEQTNRDFREVARTTDHSLKASVSTRMSRVGLQASFERSKRDIGDYVFNAYHTAEGNALESPALPFLREFDQAARDRDEVQVIVTGQLTEALSLSAMALYGRDDFSKSLFGVIDNSHRTYSMDANYSPGDRLSFYASYTAEQYFSFMRARAWSPAAPSNPYTRETGFDSNSNWEARPRDYYRTASLGLEADLIPSRLHLNLAYVYSKSDGFVSFASPVGVAANDTNPFEPAAFSDHDDIKVHSLNPELEYRFGARLSLSAGYQYEKYNIVDVNYQGFTFTPTNLTGGINAGLLMGGNLFPNYGVNVFYARLKARL